MKLNAIDLNKMFVFVRVAQHGGYKGASDELNLTRSAISQSITNLEDHLGKKLFNRVGSKMQLTESAQVLFRDCTQYFSQFEKSLSQFKGKESNVEGQLRIGAYLEFAKSKLMPVVEEFMLTFPKVQMKFSFDAPSRLENLLENDKIDIAISVFPHKSAKSIESKKLYQEELVLIGRTDLISLRPGQQDLMKCNIIDYYPSHLLFKRWWHHQYSKHIKTLKISSYAATAEMVYEMVNRRLGIGVVPRYVFDAFSNDKIHILQPTDRKLFDYVWLSQYKQKNRDLSHQEFLNILSKRFIY